MTTAPPTRAVANLHLHLEYDSGLDVIAAAMAAIPEGSVDTDEHRGHVAGDISSAVAHLLDIDAITPEGCPVRVTDVSMEVSVDIDEPDPDVRSPEDAAELRQEAESLFGALAMSEEDISVIARAQMVAETAGPPPFHLAPERLTDIPKFIAEWGLVCGYFARACEWVIDGLFDELHQVTKAEERGEEPPLTDLAGSLPEQWNAEYTVAFYRKFIVTMTDVTTRVVAGWNGPATIAQALAMSYLVGLTGTLAEVEGVPLRDDMLAELDERVSLGELVDAVFEGDDPLLAFEHWFVPFEIDEVLAPYATDELD